MIQNIEFLFLLVLKMVTNKITYDKKCKNWFLSPLKPHKTLFLWSNHHSLLNTFNFMLPFTYIQNFFKILCFVPKLLCYGRTDKNTHIHKDYVNRLRHTHIYMNLNKRSIGKSTWNIFNLILKILFSSYHIMTHTNKFLTY